MCPGWVRTDMGGSGAPRSRRGGGRHGRLARDPAGRRPDRRLLPRPRANTLVRWRRRQELIKTAIERFQAEVPALAQLKLVFELELRGRGDVQMFRVELPGPKITKAASTEDARVTVEMPRSHFNELAEEGTVRDYREAYEAGQIKVSGDPSIQKLIAQVIERHEQRARTKKVH